MSRPDFTLAQCSTLAHCSVGFNLRPAIPACCSCFRQHLLMAWPGDCLFSIGCRTDHEEILGTHNAHPWAKIKPNLWYENSFCGQKTIYQKQDTTKCQLSLHHRGCSKI